MAGLSKQAPGDTRSPRIERAHPLVFKDLNRCCSFSVWQEWDWNDLVRPIYTKCDFRLNEHSSGKPVFTTAWVPAEIFQRGAKSRELAKTTYSAARSRHERKFSRFFLRFGLNLGLSDVSAEVASETFRVFCTDTAYDVIIFKFQRRPTALGCPPFRAPMGVSDSAGVWFRHSLGIALNFWLL